MLFKCHQVNISSKIKNEVKSENLFSFEFEGKLVEEDYLSSITDNKTDKFFSVDEKSLETSLNCSPTENLNLDNNSNTFSFSDHTLFDSEPSFKSLQIGKKLNENVQTEQDCDNFNGFSEFLILDEMFT